MLDELRRMRFMKKIVIIGAGHGGLQAAKVLAENGFEVAVFEKQDRGSLGYDWCDDVEPSVFGELEIPLPQGSCRPDALSFVAPFSDKPLFVYSKEETRERHIDRRELLKILISRAEEAGCIINFSSNVKNLIIENSKVCGIECDCEKHYCDLVIDSSGMNSPFRAELPDGYAITPRLNEDEYFSVYRAFFSANEGAEMPQKHRKKLYLKHLGEKGISWCVCEPNGMINVLIGRVGKMSTETFENALSELRRDNPIIGREILRGGQFAEIPIRYPLTKMVGEGYAAIGDCAFMTIPLIGSGIANSLRAGQILGEKIVKFGSTGIEALWEYQKEYYKKIGAEHFAVDALKRALLEADSRDIKYIFECGVLTEEDMLALSNGGAFKISADKIFKILKKPKFVASLAKAALKGVTAQKSARKIPEKYDEKAIAQWQKKVVRI